MSPKELQLCLTQVFSRVFLKSLNKTSSKEHHKVNSIFSHLHVTENPF